MACLWLYAQTHTYNKTLQAGLIITLWTYMQMFTVNKPSLLVYLKMKTLSKYKVSNLLAHIQCLVIQNVASYCSIF